MSSSSHRPSQYASTQVYIGLKGRYLLAIRDSGFIRGIRTREYVRKNMIVPAIESGFLAMRYPDKPNSSNQAYFLTPKGLELLQQLITSVMSRLHF